MLAASTSALRTLLFCGLSLLSAAALAQATILSPPAANTPLLSSSTRIDSILPADSAFRLQTFAAPDDEIIIKWEIEAGYYLYQESIKLIDAEGTEVLGFELPLAQNHTDEFFGDVEVYYKDLLFKVPTALLRGKQLNKNQENLSFTLGYQGCAEDKYCYPPQRKPITIKLK